MSSETESQTATAAAADPSTSAIWNADVKVGEERKGNCVVYFDALWFCYSPAYQLREVYIKGNVDDCASKWTDLLECLKRKTTKYKDEVLQADAEKRHPLWNIRTHAEAESFWRQEFGHLSAEGGEATGEPVGEGGGEGHHSGRPTLV